mmetsp:Transcript_17081/g.30606  ORF Transcript_17081/g.30606 Transcript_17081/m.30606 type:complete len:388 (+) Transcript_17081:364-1527(+)
MDDAVSHMMPLPSRRHVDGHGHVDWHVDHGDNPIVHDAVCVMCGAGCDSPASLQCGHNCCWMCYWKIEIETTSDDGWMACAICRRKSKERPVEQQREQQHEHAESEEGEDDSSSLELERLSSSFFPAHRHLPEQQDPVVRTSHPVSYARRESSTTVAVPAAEVTAATSYRKAPTFQSTRLQRGGVSRGGGIRSVSRGAAVRNVSLGVDAKPSSTRSEFNAKMLLTLEHGQSTGKSLHRSISTPSTLWSLDGDCSGLGSDSLRAGLGRSVHPSDHGLDGKAQAPVIAITTPAVSQLGAVAKLRRDVKKDLLASCTSAPVDTEINQNNSRCLDRYALDEAECEQGYKKLHNVEHGQRRCDEQLEYNTPNISDDDGCHAVDDGCIFQVEM